MKLNKSGRIRFQKTRCAISFEGYGMECIRTFLALEPSRYQAGQFCDPNPGLLFRFAKRQRCRHCLIVQSTSHQHHCFQHGNLGMTQVVNHEDEIIFETNEVEDKFVMSTSKGGKECYQHERHKKYSWKSLSQTMSGGRTCRYDRCYWNLETWGGMKTSQKEDNRMEAFGNPANRMLVVGNHSCNCVRCFLQKSSIKHWYKAILKRQHFATVLQLKLPVLKQNFSPYTGCRVGEASNPGPSTTENGCSLKLAFVNPTAINKKVQTLLELQSDIICLAETSATTLVQQSVTSQLRANGYNSLWSPPVPPHAATTREDAAFRGAATGVSIHSTWPIRHSRAEYQPEIDQMRIISGIIELGSIHVHIITLYGYPKPHRDSYIKTNQLLESAARMADEVGIPAIIVGDLNHPPDKFFAARIMKQYGYQTTADVYRRLYQQEMPNTCREATCNDQAFIHPDLIQHITQVSINKDKLFSDHDPVEIILDIPTRRPCKQIFRLPKTWLPYEPDKVKVAEHFETFAKNHSLPLSSIDPNLTPDALKLWAMGVEDSLKKAVREQNQENPEKFLQPNLPKQCLGRGRDPKIVKIPPKVPVKKACAGQYTPEAEIVTFRIKMKTRQVRRLQSLRNRIAKVSMMENQFEATVHSLRAEWRAITKAKGFPFSFPSYCMTHTQMQFYPLDFPSISWLDEIIQLLCQDIDQEVVLEKRKHRESSKFAIWYDEKKDHLQNTMKQVKQITHPALDTVQFEISEIATLQEDDHGLVSLKLKNPTPIRQDLMLRYGGHKAQIQNLQGQNLVVMFLEDYETLPQEALITQTDYTNDPSKIATKLNHFWNQFWCRDNQDDFQPESWAHFQTFLNECPKQPTMQLDLCNVELWKKAIATTKIRSAKGTDGWTVEELRALPDVCIQVLANIFASLQGQSFPTEWSHSVTIPLGKHDNPETPSQTRPITLIPMLYRWWTKVITKQILKKWGQVAPPGLIGFLPTRSAQIELMEMQWQFEKAHDSETLQDLHWQGLTLDLVKCFNLLPRRPTYQAMIHFGVPKEVADIWYNTLACNTRWWKIQNQIWHCGSSTTGAPEGDTWSVIACLAVSWVWQYHIATTTAKPLSYADNWGWKVKSITSNLASIQITINLTNALRLKIDWGKTWAWTTQTTGKKQWEKELKNALPDLKDLTIVTHARELGYMIHYNKVSSRETQMIRHLAALEQLKKLKHIPVSLDSKALISTYAMHKALYGTETYAVGQNWTKELRSAMAKAIVPYKNSSNPHLAVMMLSKMVIDPELYLIRQSLILCRKMLMKLSADEQTFFLQRVAKHTGDFRYVRGPAGTLKFNLQRIGWSFSEDGQIHTDTVVTFHIMKDSIPDILKFLEYSWLKNMTQTCLNRQVWRNFPVPNRVATLHVVKKLSLMEQKTASRAITGAFMVSRQSQHFTERDSKCDMCDAEDSTEHRIMHCPQTRQVCYDHPELMEFLQDHHPCHFEIPVVYLDEDFEFNWFFYAHRPPPVPSEPVLQIINSQIAMEQQIVLFTDGSCIRPAHPWHRRAAFAVILATSVEENERLQDVLNYKRTDKIPPTFQTLAVAECQGLQTIPRAELQALVCAAKLGIEATVYTDSAYVVDIFNTLRTTDDLSQLAAMNNFDIIQQLWETGGWRKLHIKKVKAHELTKKGDDSNTTWLKLGNEAADQVAKTALKRFDSIMPMHSGFQHHELSKKMLAEQFSLRTKQQIERAKFYEMQRQQNQTPTGALNFQPQLEKLKQWSPKETWSPSRFPEDLEKLRLCTWTTSYADALLNWLTQLRWPLDNGDEHDITWFEMAFAFQTAIQCGLIYNSGQQGRFFLPKWSSRDDTTVRYGKQVMAFERCVEQLQKLLHRRLIPERKSNCTTILILGANHYRPGLIARPVFPYQKQINEALFNHFANLKLNDNLTGPPLLPEVPAQIHVTSYDNDAADFIEGWQHRVSRQRLFLRHLD